MPDFTFERAALVRLGDGPVCGIDEAGRGPLAGPVVAAAVIIDVERLPPGLDAEIDDSKALNRARRERVFAAMMDHVEVGIGAAEVDEIDAVNILQATFLAMRRAVEALPRPPRHALVDGNRAPRLGCGVETIVGGDALCLSIAAASIVAKVTRDRLMTALARQHPHYGWERNAGYGTAEHRAAIELHGPTRHHRRTFMPIANLLTQRDS